MSLEYLIKDQGWLQPDKSDRKEIDALREVVKRNFADASVAGLSSDNKFNLSYMAMLNLAIIVIRCSGYRVATKTRHHETAIQAAGYLLETEEALNLTDYLDTCRNRRNKMEYEVAGVVSKTEAAEALAKALHFSTMIESWINENHPQFK